ncbi:MAG: S8 family peptidase [Lewinellaceae bacterium]|nr:S8 family peptidase [Lewinellaceae bacterium]
MTKKFCFAILFSLSTLAAASGQGDERRFGEMLVQLNAEASPATVLFALNQALPGATGFFWKKPVAPDWQIYLLGFDESTVDPNLALAVARRLPDVQVAQWNRRVYERGTFPNDPDWFKQEDMALIGMTDAWDVTTGGLTPAGDTIVVAVLEKGALLTHPDLTPNVWFNWAEIPNNNIDDDGNGYVDDFRGWNPRTQSDHPGIIGFHGTAVNGIIGASGNNGAGVSGVNWKVKLMNFANIEYEDEIVGAYSYAAKMRHRYNTTNGAQGAFVVASNASFGVNNKFPSDYPLWCAVYDSLGKVGILNIGATTNDEFNVDVVGDMPSTCPSEHLLVVNNVDKFDKKMQKTGYGATHVDFGAPGEGSYTTRSQDVTPTYGAFSGTSASAPHATGAVALLYSLQCAKLTEDALTNPIECTRRIRDIILENVSPNVTLKNVTTTGGRLDVAGSVRAVQELCDGAATGRLDILWARPNPVFDELSVRFRTPTYTPYQVRVFNILGQQLYEEIITPSPFSSNIWKYDVRRLPRGVYVVAFGRNDAWRSVKFVKK